MAEVELRGFGGGPDVRRFLLARKPCAGRLTGAVTGRADAHPASLIADREKTGQSSLSLLPDRLGEGAPAGTDRDNDYGGCPHRRQRYAVHAADESSG